MINTYSYTDIGGRPHNEDAVCIRQTGENQLLAVLADGLGRHSTADGLGFPHRLFYTT